MEQSLAKNNQSLSGKHSLPGNPHRTDPLKYQSDALAYCRKIARSHYENFPVASWLLPARLRGPVSAIYAFARTADDYADEGDRSPEQRIELLDNYASQLDILRNDGRSDDPVLSAIAYIVKKYSLPWEPFYKLIKAFRMDVSKRRFADFDEILFYCQHSANPVGRLLLYLYGAATDDNIDYSDKVCSALQLINFYQDIRQDYLESGRIYLAQDEMQQYGVTEDHIKNRRSDDALRCLMQFQIARARTMLLAGAPLGRILKGRPGLELRLIIQGGLKICNALSRQHDDLFSRPRLSKTDKIDMLLRAVFK